MLHPWPRRAARALAFLPLVLAIFWGGCASSEAPVSPTTQGEGEGVLGQWVSAGGYRRTYALHLPPDYDGARQYPLIIMFHGAGGSHEQAYSVGLVQAATTGGFILAAPDGLEGDWAFHCGGCTYADRIGVDDVAFVDVLVRQLSEGLSIAPGEVFVAGVSDGGAFTHEVACAYPVAGAAVVAGTMFNASTCQPPKRVPFVGFHGTADGIVSFSYGAASARRWAELNECASGPDEKALPDLSLEDGTTVFRYDYGDCPEHADVTFFAVRGGGHSWPGIPPWPGRGLNTQDIKASEEIVRFFSDHRRPE